MQHLPLGDFIVSHCYSKSLVIILAFALPLLAGVQKTASPEFRARVNTVSVDLEVLDHAGQPVKDLARKDLIVKENGRPMEITHFVRLRNRPVSLAIVLDKSAIELRKLDVAKQFIFRLIYNLGHHDDICLFTFNQNEAHQEVGFTTDRAPIVTALSNISLPSRGPDILFRELFEATPPTGLGIDLALRRLAESRNAKKALLVISNRFEGLGPVTVKHVQDSGCTLLTLGFNNKLAAIITLGENEISRNQLTRESGGRSFSAETEDMESVCKAIAYSLKNYYAVAYQTEIKPGDVKPRHIEVQVLNHQYTINARRSYLPGKQAGS